MSAELNEYNLNLARIEGLIGWNQNLTETDKAFYRDHLLSVWEAAKKVLEEAKATEMSIRTRIVKFAFNPEQKGTQRVPLANGYALKAVVKFNYGFVKTPDGKRVNKAAVDNALRAIEAKGPVAAHIAGELVKWNPELSLTEYNKLEGDLAPLKSIIDTVIVKTPGAPTLEIEEPKGKKAN